MDNSSLAHTKWNCKYHIVFAPKYRRQIIYGKIKADIGRILRELCEYKKVEIIEANACKDHIHMQMCIRDSHMGDIIGYKEIEEILQKINNLKPDVILIAGDIFDGDYYAVEDIEKIENEFKTLKSKYGIYAVLGNHDAGDSYDKSVEFFNSANIKLLQDEFIEVEEEFIVAGRKDFSSIRRQGNERKDVKSLLENVDTDKPIIMLDHQPSAINEEADNNVDLLLCGHTHKGQLFPGNLITNNIFLDDYGYLKVQNTNVIVSSGVGTWGPRMRIGSKSEICLLYTSRCV